MATRQVRITDDKRRDAHVELESPRARPRVRYVTPSGAPAETERLIKATEAHTFEALLRRFGDEDALATALQEGDPEIPLGLVGRRVGPADRVWLRADGSVLYCARTLLVRTSPTGEELERTDFVDVAPTVSPDGEAIPWSGRLFSPDEVVRKFAIGRVVRLRHVNGLTYDFLHQIAATLQREGKLLLVRALAESDDGKKRPAPLIFQTNGSPYNGFLEGRVDGEGYLLRLHLSNLELKRGAA